MRVFITGASGWIGSAVTDELIGAGHDVVALARSQTAADALQTKAVGVLRGDLDDAETLDAGARDADAVVHLANKHNWSDTSISNRAERAAVQTIADALAGTDRPFVLASGVAGLAQGRPAIETDQSPFVGPDSSRGGSERLALDYVSRGVRTVSLRFAPTVHGIGDPQFIAFIAAAARRHGISAFVDDGEAVWSAVHRDDAARLVRLGLEQGRAGEILHAVGEPGVSTRAIAEAISRRFEVPLTSVPASDAVAHFGFIGALFGKSFPARSDQTRRRTGWIPTGPGLLADIDAGAYDNAVAP